MDLINNMDHMRISGNEPYLEVHRFVFEKQARAHVKYI